GRYSMWGQDLEVQPGGKVVVPGTPFLAGSGVFLDACVRTVLSLGEVSLADAIDMAGAAPRRLLGVPPRRLEAGQPAEAVLFEDGRDEPFALRETHSGGRVNLPPSSGV